MGKNFGDKNCLLLLEYGIPHYRYFIYDWIRSQFNHFKIIHSGERFGDTDRYSSKRGINIKLPYDISICFFNTFELKKYDVIISTLNFRKPHTWMLFFLFNKKKWIFWGEGVGRSKFFLLRSLKRKIINNSQGYVVYTKEGEKDLRKLGVDKENISIANNTLKIENSEFTNGKNYLLYVGRLQERKGLDKVLKTIVGTDYQFVIVGEGKVVKKELIQLIDEYNIQDQVVFKGSIYDDDKLKKIFSNAIAYISPDHVGLGVVHSFAYGVPVITYKAREHAPEIEYCNKENSYLIENNGNLKETINLVFKNDHLRISKKRSAYKFYKDNLDYKNVIEAFRYHLKKVVN